MKTQLLLILLIGCYTSYSQKEAKIDTTTFKIGNNTVVFINNAPDSLDYDYNFNKTDSTICTSKTKDEWPKLVIEIGTNGYVTPSQAINLPKDQDLLELNYGRSRSFGFAFQFKGIESNNKRLFLSPGLGITWNGYHFENNINISSSNDTTVFFQDTLHDNRKYKLRTTYLELPLLIGTRIGNTEKPLNIQVGVIGGIRIGSIIKQKFEENGVDQTVKIKDDFNINPFKIDLVAKITFGEVGIFGRYSTTTLFQDGKGAELYPFSIGLTFGGLN